MQPRRTSPRRILFTCGLALLLGGLSMLIWTRLRVVTGVPRTAYAQPERTPAPPPSQAVEAPIASAPAPGTHATVELDAQPQPQPE